MESRPRSEDDVAEAEDDRPRVSALESAPGRIVFTEEGNSDAWIATDLAVDPEP